MVLPNFLIIGAQKSGSTWLAQTLGQHPEVFIAPQEIHYFNHGENFRKGCAWYEAHFAPGANRGAIGEKTPNYLWVNVPAISHALPNSHTRVHALLPEAKLVLVLRNPVDRAISALNTLMNNRHISPLHNLDDLLVGSAQGVSEEFGVLSMGCYHTQIQAYRQYFTDKQMLVLIFEEDIATAPANALKQVCAFLGIDPDFIFSDSERRVNASTRTRVSLLLNHYLPGLSRLGRHIDPRLVERLRPLVAAPRPRPETIDRLYRFYAPENEKLFELLQRWPASWQFKERTAAAAQTA